MSCAKLPSHGPLSLAARTPADREQASDKLALNIEYLEIIC
jgi:hypothetical protein